MQLKFLTRIIPPIPGVPAARALASCLVAGLLVLGAPAPGLAHGLFTPAIWVNDDAITYFELDQRTKFLDLLRAPGDTAKLAREVLIEERLKKQAIEAAGLEVTQEEIDAGIEEFSARTNLSPTQFIQALAEGGVARETLRDFVTMGILWRKYASTQFLEDARPSESELDRAMGQADPPSARVLLSEVIIPITPQTVDQAEELARQISQTRGPDAFAAAATQYSASQTRANGGDMDWLSLDDLPAGLRPLFLTMKPGENTAPVSLPNAIAVFRLRAIAESAVPRARYASIDYASYFIAGGRSPEALAIARSVRDRADACDDLYAIARDQPPEVLERQTRAPGDIPRDIALELAKLDEGEISTTLTTRDGQTLVLLMLCGRTTSKTQKSTREEVAQALTVQRLEILAAAHLNRLEADALIVEE